MIIVAKFRWNLSKRAPETNNLRKTGKNDRFSHENFFNFYLRIQSTCVIILAELGRNLSKRVTETDNFRKNIVGNTVDLSDYRGQVLSESVEACPRNR